VYVYENTKSSTGFKLIAVSQHSEIRDKDVRTLSRQFASDGSRFGISLLSLGRLDADIYEDFAVGAPYENGGQGVVYVYRGSKDYFWSINGKEVRGNIILLAKNMYEIMTN
jgi:hypothetical protein